MGKILKVGDKAYKATGWGIQSIAVERITPKTAFWTHGLKCKLDDNKVIENGTGWNKTYYIPQTEQEEKQWGGKMRQEDLKQQAAVLLDKLSKKAKAMSAEELEKLIGAVTPFAGD